MIYLRLFLEFFKTGLFAVGGGLATLPFLYEMSNTKGWFTHTDIANMIAVSESTPGAIGINMSTYSGFTTAGVLGALCATIGLAMPSIIIIIVIAKALQNFSENKLVKGAFYGLRPASIAMITAAGINVAKITLVNMSVFASSISIASFGNLGSTIADFFIWKAWALGIAIFAVSKKWKLHPIILIAASAVIGVIFKF